MWYQKNRRFRDSPYDYCRPESNVSGKLTLTFDGEKVQISSSKIHLNEIDNNFHQNEIYEDIRPYDGRILNRRRFVRKPAKFKPIKSPKVTLIPNEV